MKVLVTGLLPYDSGKTEFTRALSSVFRSSGYKVLYFKPVGGHSGWYQFDTVIHSLELKLLVGHDAYVLAKELELLDMIDILSPIDFLTLPVNPLTHNISARRYIDYMSMSSRIMILLRLTRVWREDGLWRRFHTYIFCKDTYDRINPYLKGIVDELVGSIKMRDSIIIEATTEYTEKILDDPKIYALADEALNYINSMGYDILFIEGYNNVAAPTWRSLDVDYVFVAAPGRVLLYNGIDYRRGVELLSYRGLPWTITTDKIIDLLKNPIRIFDIPPYTHDKYYPVMEEIKSTLEKGVKG